MQLSHLCHVFTPFHTAVKASILESMEAAAPGLAAELFAPLPNWRVEGQDGLADAGVLPAPQPVLARRGGSQEGALSCYLYRPFLERACKAVGYKLTPAQTAALDLFQEKSLSPNLTLRFHLKPGQTIILHNRCVTFCVGLRRVHASVFTATVPQVSHLKPFLVDKTTTKPNRVFFFVWCKKENNTKRLTSNVHQPQPCTPPAPPTTMHPTVHHPQTPTHCSARSVLHARTDYEDYRDIWRRRHLLRMWIDAPNAFPVHPEHELGDLFLPPGEPVQEAYSAQ